MAGANMVEQVLPGMQVRSSDSRQIGKVSEVHQRDTDIYIEVVPKASWRFWQVDRRYLFLPASAIAEVADRQVTLNMDANAARSCTRRPPWIPGLIPGPDGGGIFK